MDSQTPCSSCRRPQSVQKCGICQADLCKKCLKFLDASTFAFWGKVPPDVSHTYYCEPCFEEKVQPVLESYEEILARAREVFFFFITQRKTIPILKKSKESIRVADCPDRDETILRLGFMAAEQGANAVVEAEVLSEKIRNGGHQTSRWKGTGVVAWVDAERLERHLRR